MQAPDITRITRIGPTNSLSVCTTVFISVILMNDKERKEYDDELFGPIIFSYTDKQAIEDGVLVDVSRFAKGGVNRITASVYEFLGGDREAKDFAPKYRELEDVARAALVKSKDNELTEFSYKGQRFWFMDNETGGKTIMFPEDY